MATKKKAKKAAARKAPAKKKAAARAPAKALAKPAQLLSNRRVERTPEGLRLRSAAPGFTVNDIEKSLAFYTKVLGFTTKERWERDGKLSGAELVAGNVTFYLGQDDWKKGRDRVKGEGFRIYCTTVQDLNRLAARIKAHGGTLTQEPTDQPWGWRDFAFVDPDGFKITISTETTKP